MASTKTQKTIKNMTGMCGCGCGSNVPSNRTFRPGHDARLVSLLVKAITGARGGDRQYAATILELDLSQVNDQQAEIDDATRAISAKFGSPLAGKFFNAAMNSWTREVKGTERKASKASKAQVPADQKAKVIRDSVIKTEETWEDGEPVQIGRWSYPTRVSSLGRTQRNKKTNGKGEWVDVA